jgi:proteasome lid subunit RPN8/RPN11
MAKKRSQQDYALAITAPERKNVAPVVYDVIGNAIDIGTADDNHIVVSDPSVDPYHVTVRRIGQQVVVIANLAAAQLRGEGYWLARRGSDSVLCLEHGRIPRSPEPDHCALCTNPSAPLLLMRVLQAGDIFPIGTAFEATLLHQGTASVPIDKDEPVHSPWPDIHWLENPPSQANFLAKDMGRALEERHYPYNDSNLWIWSPPESEFPVFIHNRVNRYAAWHARQHMDREVGGLLLGHVYRDPIDKKIYPVVTQAIPARHATEERGHLTFTRRTWLDFLDRREEQFPNEEVVGWYHTHPGFDIFLSQWDLMIHRNFFREPWSIALVIDPHLDKAGIFVWTNGDILDPMLPHQPFRVLDTDNDYLADHRPRIRIKLESPQP